MLRFADPRFGSDALEAIGEVLRSGQLAQGPVVAAFERAIADFCEVRNAVATTSGTTAIELTLAGLGIGPGQEVLAADFTFPATGNAVLARSATLRLVDVDPDTFCIDVDALAGALTAQTSAVIAVDAFGLPADYDALEALLAKHGAKLICDAACSLGGAIGSRRTGGFGHASCFSFHPRKSLTTGEGGMVTTNDDELASRLRRLRDHGSVRDGYRSRFLEPGFNFRMSDVSAALGLSQVGRLTHILGRRRDLAAKLIDAIGSIDGVTPQRVPSGYVHPYQAFVVKLDEQIHRDAVFGAVSNQRIEATLGTYALHAEPSFRLACGVNPGKLANSYALAHATLTLPLHHRLGDEDMRQIAAALESALDCAQARGET